MKISAGTIARTIILVLALINQGLTVAGHSVIPIEDETITEVVSLLFMVISAVAAWWKNNSFTSAAVEADLDLKEIRANVALVEVAAARDEGGDE